MFIRVKKIKGQSYAYLVENRWPADEQKEIQTNKEPDEQRIIQQELQPIKTLKKQPKQTVKEYLGKVYTYQLPKTAFNKKLKKEYKESITELIKWHLAEYGFSVRKDYLLNKDLVYNIEKAELRKRKTKTNAVISSHNGFICNHALQELYMFDGRGYDEEVGKRLAKALVKAGLNVPKEVFVQLFEKVFKEER